MSTQDDDVVIVEDDEVAVKKPKMDGDASAATAKNDSDANGDAKNGSQAPLSNLDNLKDFKFVEVLGSVPEKKLIFVLCQNTVENKSAILILNKIAYSESEADMNECIQGLRLIHVSDNDVYGSFEAVLPEKFNLNKSTFIYPASEKHIEKYRFKPLHLIYESAEDYKNLTLPFIQESQFNIDWVYNILDGKKEQDLILFKDEDKEKGFLLCRDLKWDGKTVEELYYQVIVVRRDLKSVRDLTDKEIPLLENILSQSIKAIEKEHGIKASQLIMYFHYQPTYYHLHVHIRHLGQESQMSFVPLQTAIQNIRISADYYQRATLPCVLKEGLPLFKKFQEAGRL